MRFNRIIQELQHHFSPVSLSYTGTSNTALRTESCSDYMFGTAVSQNIDWVKVWTPAVKESLGKILNLNMCDCMWL